MAMEDVGRRKMSRATMRNDGSRSCSMRQRLWCRERELGEGTVVARQGRGLRRLFIGLGSGGEQFVE
jgi:hypothetical protein